MNQIVKKLIFLAPLLFFLVYLQNKGEITWPTAFGIFTLALLAQLLILWKDIKEQSTNKIGLDDQQTLFVNILENLTDPLLFIDRNETILLANKAATDMFGKKVIDHKISDFLMDSEALYAIKGSIETGKSATVEFTLQQPHTKSYLLRIHVHDKSGSILDGSNPDSRTLLLTIYDITSIREAERMRVDFVANVSHEMRTPLASILGFVETLQGPAKNDAEVSKRFLKIMQEEASRMLRLIEDLLSLSSIERDVHIPPSDKVSLNKTIDNVIDTLNTQLASKNMTTLFEHKNFAEIITADRDQLTQVFQNLIENAIKYGADDSQIEITLSLYENENDAQTYLKVRIQNRGLGIAQEHIARLTERFYRVDTARSRSLGGTGLGLAIVKHILQRHDGKLEFESEVGKYTAAIVYLPVTIKN